MKALKPTGFHKKRRTKNWTDYEHDPYRGRGKLPDPTRCPDCGAVFRDGRWQWTTVPATAHEKQCAACKRIHDDFPAGYVTLTGSFFVQHRAEILQIVRNHEDREKAEHPMQRIMEIEEKAGGASITTTDVHLARGIGEAVHKAYQGDLSIEHGKAEDLVRVFWARELAS